ncbi:hypothetical protein [Sphingomonas sp. R1]|uniref:hypothetical protein n=1 Tax=Sphingomonas sp. R1 TaxID=399176 RepID=UPI0022245F1B|nr:hypothetical protein [Sphingomonas sp. R1]UYY78407.1 hypothetical protein OIM94_05235 [Sphingomonas sp. R1]
MMGIRGLLLKKIISIVFALIFAVQIPAKSTILIGSFSGFIIDEGTSKVDFSLPIKGSFKFDSSILGDQYLGWLYDSLHYNPPVHIEYSIANAYFSFDTSYRVIMRIFNESNFEQFEGGCSGCGSAFAFDFLSDPSIKPNEKFGFSIESRSTASLSHEQYSLIKADGKSLNFDVLSGVFLYLQTEDYYIRKDVVIGASLPQGRASLSTLSVHSAVPETETWAFLSLGFFAVGGYKRMRPRQRHSVEKLR